jgi:hypothetical protein
MSWIRNTVENSKKFDGAVGKKYYFSLTGCTVKYLGYKIQYWPDVVTLISYTTGRNNNYYQNNNRHVTKGRPYVKKNPGHCIFLRSKGPAVAGLEPPSAPSITAASDAGDG